MLMKAKTFLIVFFLFLLTAGMIGEIWILVNNQEKITMKFRTILFWSFFVFTTFCFAQEQTNKNASTDSTAKHIFQSKADMLI